MLKGSSERLMFGALIASMTATLFLPGVWLAYQYFNDKSSGMPGDLFCVNSQCYVDAARSCGLLLYG
ncbi:hypothetical protein KUH03_00670 [Sphingobacterium sp. E70]|uniref:hypothetical protein n=1 Tax=Sphingobacterium sp. E70 TaxID=2853439 RepID=UPI00211C0092|nr:hypothetical protein [Sphingobacterium sp. E70]ULT25562.1 hypothetical protein KUH03_00670 [Sphingobacterium sp. E70]